MGARLGVAWLHQRIRASWPDDSLEDLDDYLAGDDARLNERDQKHRRDLIVAGGGEIG